MSKVLDARGLSCPQPVILTLDEIKSGNESILEILVDTDTSRENVTRAATHQGWTIADVDENGTGYRITIKKQ